MNQSLYPRMYKHPQHSCPNGLCIHRLRAKLLVQQDMIRHLTALANRTRIQIQRLIELEKQPDYRESPQENNA